MKTCLHTPGFLDGFDAQGSPRLARNIRFLQYYSRLQGLLHFEKFFLFDNGSLLENIEALKQVESAPKQIFFYEHLKRGDGLDYPFLWRALYETRRLIELGYEKIIFLDSDCFILTKRLVDYVNQLQTGWTSLWCKKHQFPESQLSILCQDQFDSFLRYTTEMTWQERNGRLMERELPFTWINKDFVCDRYGEDEIPQSHEMDCYGQARVRIELKFNPNL